MKGLLFIFIIYGLTLLLCVGVKVIFSRLDDKKRSPKEGTSKIYYVTPQKKARKKQDNTIPIKASVIEKEKIDN